jgi:hypothetical protein
MGGDVAKRKKRNRLNEWWLHYEYKHTTFAVVAIVVFVLLLDSAFLTGVFEFIEGQHYLGGLIAGVLSASFFTAAPAVVMIVDLATKLDPLPLAVIVGVGAAVGDMLLLLFFEERIYHELKPLFIRLHPKRFRAGRQPRRRSTAMLLIGTFVITTPLPDEVGLSLLGISHFPKVVILVICLGLNVLGAALLILGARAIAG